MKIWIDGDACPKQIKEIVFRAAMKRQIGLFIVANHLVTIPPSRYIKRILVASGFDAADRYIVEHVNQHDLVITADIILADLVVSKKALAINPRGTLYSEANIKQILASRDLNESLRNNGLISGGCAPLSTKDIQLFSNNLDKTLTKQKNQI